MAMIVAMLLRRGYCHHHHCVGVSVTVTLLLPFNIRADVILLSWSFSSSFFLAYVSLNLRCQLFLVLFFFSSSLFHSDIRYFLCQLSISRLLDDIVVDKYSKY